MYPNSNKCILEFFITTQYLMRKINFINVGVNYEYVIAPGSIAVIILNTLCELYWWENSTDVIVTVWIYLLHYWTFRYRRNTMNQL